MDFVSAFINNQSNIMINGIKGDGFILDISTSGCAVVSTTLEPSTDDIIQTEVTFTEAGNLLSWLKASANLVRVKNDTFAAKFKDLDSELKEQL